MARFRHSIGTNRSHHDNGLVNPSVQNAIHATQRRAADFDAVIRGRNRHKIRLAHIFPP